MRALLPLIALTVACNAVGHLGVVGDPILDDTADTDTDADADADADADTDTDTDADTDTGPQTDMSVWNGLRHFSYPEWDYDCEEPAVEEGERIVEGSQDFEWLQERCPGCEYLYRVEVSPQYVCDWARVTLAQETWRGLEFRNDGVSVWRLDDDATYELDRNGTWNGADITYAYDSSSLHIEGEVHFPMID